ncbi:MAG: thiamine phosphate synthase [Fusobacteriaceae bacterium]|jgi:thiamine-phosphate pyrophosphorylase|nr:thiamine phosphate synthase [Fusobacteriaceae bacterium]
MRSDSGYLTFYAVTDRAWIGENSLALQVESALKGGVSCVQLREKDLPFADFLAEAREIKNLCRRYDVPFIVNDNVDIAIATGADGVHIGQSDEPVEVVRKRIPGDMLLGVSAQTVEDALRAEAQGADYLGVGAVFPTATKPDAITVSKETLASICKAVRIPVVAIGGITKENLPTLCDTGIAGVALVSAVFAARDIERECRALKTAIEDIVRVRKI